MNLRVAAALYGLLAWVGVAAESPSFPDVYIANHFENASPLWWEVGDEGELNLHLLYDHERSSPNRAAGHWFFQLQAPTGSKWRLILNNLDNVWNGRHGSPVSDRTISFISRDGRDWAPIETVFLPGDRLQIDVTLPGPTLYVARLPVFRLSDLERFLDDLRPKDGVAIEEIGRTVEGRPLQMVCVGDPQAPHRVLLRSRAHAWEPGGDWVVTGMIRRFLADDGEARRWRSRFSLAVLPMANRDGVARGGTRFNSLGMDLNRNWDRPASENLAPENAALERWLTREIAAGRKPDLAIDFHNDEGGRLHVSRPESGGDRYLANMQRFETLLREHTWFTEGSTDSSFRNPGSLGEGMLARFGIDACIHELNANWIAGLRQPPSAAAWELYGAQLLTVFDAYFAGEGGSETTGSQADDADR
ncbi:MAG: peptidase M14 [Verrucomicrobiae bacterium]|nr:peptidase M14 [Verrucomicrobiae bacterium]MCP5523837.1 peptidase M14 [Verrucomicrobiales bacterium]